MSSQFYLKTKALGWWSGSAGKSTCCWQPELTPLNKGRENQLLKVFRTSTDRPCTHQYFKNEQSQSLKNMHSSSGEPDFNPSTPLRQLTILSNFSRRGNLTPLPLQASVGVGGGGSGGVLCAHTPHTPNASKPSINSTSRGPDILFWPEGTRHTCGTDTYMQVKHSYK